LAPVIVTPIVPTTPGPETTGLVTAGPPYFEGMLQIVTVTVETKLDYLFPAIRSTTSAPVDLTVNLLCCSNFVSYDQTNSLLKVLKIDPFDDTFLGFYIIPLLLTDSSNPLL
jgi:hypothetical protein